MSRESQRLWEAMSSLSDEKIDQGAAFATQKRLHRRRWMALAACLVLVLGIGAAWRFVRFGASAGGTGSEDGVTFQVYAGPVFPLALGAADDAVTAFRTVTLDFAPWEPVWISNEAEAASRTYLTEAERQEVLEQYDQWFPEGGYYQESDDIRVTDEYVLTNASSEDRTATVRYPFAAPLYNLQKLQPSLTAEGEALETVLRVGAYSGGFTGVWEANDPEGSANLSQPAGWEDYRDLLSDGSYLENALGPAPSVDNIPVIVYRFTDPYGPEADEAAGVPNPTLRVSMDRDYGETTVLSYGFHAGAYDAQAGTMMKGFSIPDPEDGGTYYLLVLGEDVANMAIQGYVTGGTDADTKELDGCGVTVERYESDLDTMLRTILTSDVSWQDYLTETGLGFETCYRAFLELFLQYGVLSDSGVERYAFGNLEDFTGETFRIDRVCWLEGTVTIPAGGSLTVTAEMTKSPSFDYACTRTENRGIYGYDMVTALGSQLTFTGQEAVIEDRGLVEIAFQNFGFDLETGVRRVALDVGQDHYYLGVQRRT